MGNAVAFLKKKGPLGMPMGFYVALGAVVLYLGYRYYKAKHGSSSSSDTTSTPTDTTGDTSPATPSPMDQTVPPEQTVPPPTESPPPVKDPDSGDKGKHTGTHHDHKQGSSHTKHRHLPKRGSRHHHPPRERKRELSNEKKRRTEAISAHNHPGSRSPVKEERRHPSTMASKNRVVKHAPPAAHLEEHEKKTAKQPLQKRTRR